MEQKKSFWQKIKEFVGLSVPGTVSEKEKCAVMLLMENSYELFDQVKSARSDGKIDIREWFGIGKKTLPLVNNIKNWQALKSDILDFNFGKGRELKEWIISKGVLKENAEEIITILYDYIEYQAKGWVLYGNPLLNKIKELKKRE
jgi:hypothetical protein